MDIYMVTFCTMDGDTGSSPLWHTCLLLSKFDPTLQRLEVIDNWGFYGMQTTNKTSWMRKPKKAIGLDLDFYGNHGWLKHEETRYLDLGTGLHGVTFELTEEKFKELQTKCENVAKLQVEAVEEIAKSLQLKPKAEGHYRIYPYEDDSILIYRTELTLAEANGRPPRLKRFRFLKVLDGLNDCKTQALDLLEGIITPRQHKRITGSLRPVSRLSGKMEKIHLFSRGPLLEHVKHSGEIAHYRAHGSKIYWTFPPQELEALSDEVKNLFKVSAEYCEEAKKLVSKLQKLEWLFINASLDPMHADMRQALIDKIAAHYEPFGMVRPKIAETPDAPKRKWQVFLLWLLSVPKDEHEKLLRENIEKAKVLLNNLYLALLDKSVIADPDLSLSSSSESSISSASSIEESFCPEALVAYLSIEDQNKLLKILKLHTLDLSMQTQMPEERSGCKM